MKNFYLLFIICLCLGCNVENRDLSYVESNGKIKVLSTTSMIDDIVGRIGGEEIEHTALIQGDIDPHSYELVKGDGEKLNRAEVLFFNGLGLEQGASLKRHFEKHLCAVALGDWVYAQKKHFFIFVNGQIDPHIWMDIALFSEIIDPIVQTLGAVDPVHATLFQERGYALKKEMLAKDHDLYIQMQAVPSNKRFLVTSHDAFHYFAKKYLAKPEEQDWEKRLIAPEGLAPDGQISIIDIKEVIHFLGVNNIHVIFPESNISREALKKIVSICLQKGLSVTIADRPLLGDTMKGSGTCVNSYLEMIEYNVHTFIQNLVQDHGY